MSEGTENLRKTLDRFFQGLQVGLKSLKEVRGIYDERVAFEFNSINFFRPNENKISEILAFFLNPNEAHGQKDKFLNIFLNKFLNDDELLKSEKSIEVKTEYHTDKDRRIDIVIKLGDFMIGIENKIWDAGDLKDQFQHYADFLEEKSNDKYILFYLSSYGYEPSEKSILKEHLDPLTSAGKVKVISFSEDIINLFEQFEMVCKADNVRAFIKDFQQYLKQQLLGEHIMGEREFIKEYIEKTPEIIKYQDNINAGISELRAQTYKCFMNDLVTNIKCVIPSEYSFCSHGTKKYKVYGRPCFTLKLKNLSINIIIEIWESNLYIGLPTSLNFENYDNNFTDEQINNLKNNLQEQENFKNESEWIINPAWESGLYMLKDKFTDNEYFIKLLKDDFKEHELTEIAEKINAYVEIVKKSLGNND